jgi:hypothetical protein
MRSYKIESGAKELNRGKKRKDKAREYKEN